MPPLRDPKTGRFVANPSSYDSKLRTLGLDFDKGLKLYNAIAQAFAGFPGVNFSQLYSRAVYINSLGSILAGQSGSYVLPLSQIPFRNRSLSKALSGGRIQYTLRTRFTDPNNGVTYQRYFIISSNTKLSIDQVKLHGMTQLMSYLQNSPTFDASGKEVAASNYSIDVTYVTRGY